VELDNQADDDPRAVFQAGAQWFNVRMALLTMLLEKNSRTPGSTLSRLQRCLVQPGSSNWRKFGAHNYHPPIVIERAEGA
jgi:hypothetical protein